MVQAQLQPSSSQVFSALRLECQFRLILFQGVAIYYMAPKWPFAVTTLLTVDSDPPVVVTMTSPSSVNPGGPNTVSQVLWGRTGLSNTEHTIVMSLVPGDEFVLVDALMYDALSAPPLVY